MLEFVDATAELLFEEAFYGFEEGYKAGDGLGTYAFELAAADRVFDVDVDLFVVSDFSERGIEAFLVTAIASFFALIVAVAT